MLDTTLWIAQVVLAPFFLAAGLPKVLGRGLDRWTGFDELPQPLVVVIGVSEVAAGIALVVPMVVGHGEWTTPVAALGLAVVVVMASGFHVRAGEWLAATETALWASLAGAVAIGRWGEMSTGPSLSPDVLVPLVLVLVPTIAATLVVLFRQTGQPDSEHEEELVSAS